MTIETNTISGKKKDLFVLEHDYFTELFVSITPEKELNIVCGFNLLKFAEDKSQYPEAVAIDSFWEEIRDSYIKDFYVELYSKLDSIIMNLTPLYTKNDYVFYSGKVGLSEIKLKKNITCKAKVTYIDPTISYIKDILNTNPGEVELYKTLSEKQKVLNLNSKFRLAEVEHTYDLLKSIDHNEIFHVVVDASNEITNAAMLDRIRMEEEKFEGVLDSVILSPNSFLFGKRRVENSLDNHELQKEVIVREFLNSGVEQYSLGIYAADISGLTLGKAKEVREDGNSGRSSETRSALPSAMNSGARREFGEKENYTTIKVHNIQLYDAVTKSVTNIKEPVLMISKNESAPIQVKYYNGIVDSLLSDMNKFSTIWNSSKELYIVYYMTEVKPSGEIIWDIMTKENLIGSDEPFFCKVLKYNSQKDGIVPLRGLNYTLTNEFFIIR